MADLSAEAEAFLAQWSSEGRDREACRSALAALLAGEREAARKACAVREVVCPRCGWGHLVDVTPPAQCHRCGEALPPVQDDGAAAPAPCPTCHRTVSRVPGAHTLPGGPPLCAASHVPLPALVVWLQARGLEVLASYVEAVGLGEEGVPEPGAWVRTEEAEG